MKCCHGCPYRCQYANQFQIFPLDRISKPDCVYPLGADLHNGALIKCFNRNVVSLLLIGPLSCYGNVAIFRLGLSNDRNRKPWTPAGDTNPKESLKSHERKWRRRLTSEHDHQLRKPHPTKWLNQSNRNGNGKELNTEVIEAIIICNWTSICVTSGHVTCSITPLSLGRLRRQRRHFNS